MKFYCAYDRAMSQNILANHKCDICKKFLCERCGYCKDDIDYCNECWQDRELKERKIYKIYKSRFPKL